MATGIHSLLNTSKEPQVKPIGVSQDRSAHVLVTFMGITKFSLGVPCQFSVAVLAIWEIPSKLSEQGLQTPSLFLVISRCWGNGSLLGLRKPP